MQGIDPFNKTLDPFHFKRCSNKWVFETNQGSKYKTDLLPYFPTTTSNVEGKFKEFRTMSYMFFGNCDTCQEFWEQKISPHIRYKGYNVVSKWADDTSCDIRVDQNFTLNETIDLDLLMHKELRRY